MAASWRREGRMKKAGLMRKGQALALFAGLAAATLMPAAAQARGAEAVTRIALVAAQDAHEGAPFLAGLELGLAPGWKTYWKRAGDSGFAPLFDWSASENVASVDLRWPAPRRFDEPGDTTFGYTNEVVWPLLVEPVEAGAPVTLRLTVQYGVCAKICIPREDEIELVIPPASAEGNAPSENAAATKLRAALARVPVAAADPDILDIRWRENTAPTLDMELKGCGAGCVPPQLVIEEPHHIWFGPPEVRRHGDHVRYSMPVEVLSPGMIEGEELVVILSDEKDALLIRRKM